MDQAKQQVTQKELMQVVFDFISQANGFKVKSFQDELLTLFQVSDAKTLEISSVNLKDVLTRSDTEGKTFLQVNFVEGTKILITDTLIGFKPIPVLGLKMEKLPKVVTTPDLLSVFEAIEEAISQNAAYEEVDVLRKVFDSILSGGEDVGFDLCREKQWIRRLTPTVASA